MKTKTQKKSARILSVLKSFREGTFADLWRKLGQNCSIWLFMHEAILPYILI
jgi:hypothetical protein